MKQPVRIAIVAGETSGDLLGAGLIQALKLRYPDARFEGIGGPKMLAEGFVSHYPMERLAVMGLVEVLGRLRELLGIRKALIERYRSDPPDLFIGIDAPDFNLTLEERLKASGIATVHYVGPSIWAWRQKRVFKVKRACDRVLCLLPFEIPFYQRFDVPATFVGHPLADQIPLEPDTRSARRALGIADDARVVALLPGSRGGEVQRLAPLYLAAARLMHQRQPDLEFLLPAANERRRSEIEGVLADYPELPVRLLDGQAQQAMTAADALLIASGTATLEACLLKKPMVIAYRLAGLTFAIMKRMARIRWVGLPNLLSDREIVPELLQDAATPEALAEATLAALEPERASQLVSEFTRIHHALRQNASATAAQAVAELLDRPQEARNAAE